MVCVLPLYDSKVKSHFTGLFYINYCQSVMHAGCATSLAGVQEIVVLTGF